MVAKQPKNATREHWLAPYDPESPTTIPAPEAFVLLGLGIQTIEDDTDESTDDYSDYAGDGNTSSTLTSYSEKWNYEGRNMPDDKAQTIIRKMKRKTTDDERRLWHAIRFTDGTAVIGVAKAMEIKAGSGDSSDYEDFEGHLDFDNVPKDANIEGSKADGLTTVELDTSDGTEPVVGEGETGKAEVGGEE